MSTAFELAKEQGYSDQEIGEYLSKKDPKIKQALDEGYTFDEISDFLNKEPPKPEDSPAKGALRFALQVPLGIAEFTHIGALGQLLEMGGKGEAIAGLQELEENLPRLKELYPQLPWENVDIEKGKQAIETAEKFFPFSVGGQGRILEEATGIPTGEPHTEAQRKLRLIAGGAKAAPGGIVQKTIRGASIPAVSSLLQKTGLSEPVSEFTAFLLSQARFGKGERPPKAEAIPPERKVEIPGGKPPPEPPGGGPGEPPARPPKAEAIPPTGGFVEEVERFPSGLTKPKAVGAKKAEMGIITPARQEKALEGLNKEAGKIAADKFLETFPTAKKVMEGYDMEGAFKKGFGELEAQAQKANPQIDISPFTKFLREEQAKYRGIPTLDKEAKKIMKWIEDFRSQPVSELKNLMKVYRSVNRELKGIYDRAKLSGVPDHYVNFLTRANKEIANAISETLPKDSLWMKRFDSLNKEFKNFRDAEKVSAALRPLLRGEPTAANLRKIANDPKLQRLLELKMGKQAAAEITQIAKDLETAQKAIQRMSAKTIRELDDIYPIPLLLAGMKLPGIGYVTKKVADVLRRVYGTNLLNPTTRRVYREAVEAAGKADYPAYKKATKALKKEQGLIGYEAPKLLDYKPKEPPKVEPPKPKPKIQKEKAKTSSAQEIRERLYEKKRDELLDRIERSKETQKRLENHLKENPKSENAKNLLEQSKKVQHNSEKLLKQLEEDGEEIIGSKKVISEEKRYERSQLEKKEEANRIFSSTVKNNKLHIEKLEKQIIEDKQPKGAIDLIKKELNLSNAMQTNEFLHDLKKDILKHPNKYKEGTLIADAIFWDSLSESQKKGYLNLLENLPEKKIKNKSEVVKEKSTKQKIPSDEEMWSTQNIQKTLDKIAREAAELEKIKFKSADIQDKIKSNQKMKKMFQELLEESKSKKIE